MQEVSTRSLAPDKGTKLWLEPEIWENEGVQDDSANGNEADGSIDDAVSKPEVPGENCEVEEEQKTEEDKSTAVDDESPVGNALT